LRELGHPLHAGAQELALRPQDLVPTDRARQGGQGLHVVPALLLDQLHPGLAQLGRALGRALRRLALRLAYRVRRVLHDLKPAAHGACPGLRRTLGRGGTAAHGAAAGILGVLDRFLGRPLGLVAALAAALAVALVVRLAEIEHPAQLVERRRADSLDLVERVGAGDRLLPPQLDDLVRDLGPDPRLHELVAARRVHVDLRHGVLPREVGLGRPHGAISPYGVPTPRRGRCSPTES
jgi:hypothetical protein